MKIVLPLAGIGSRLLPHTKSVPKPLLFVAGQSILDHLMDELVKLNPTEFIFITGYYKEQIETHLLTKYSTQPLRFIEQTSLEGLGHAIYQSQEAFIDDEDMLVVLGDQTFTLDWDRMLDPSCNRLSVVRVENPSLFGIVNVNDQGIIVEMEEKPESAKSNLAISGTYYFPSAKKVFSTIAHQINSNIRTKGEIQITDSMKMMMEQGECFDCLEISNWNDCGRHEDLLNANQTLLQTHNTQSLQYNETVTIIDPVWIHPSVQIFHSTIGPNVSLAENVTLSQVTIANSLVCHNTALVNCHIENSYIGSDLSVENINGSAQHLS